ncbi:hypothetical protein [Actinoplanes sp. NPDC049265]|uniref:hypothetical protein n=1 Tax=Actinoplanes sp. NPDC049265 TaxID=3363902 RepID=UPI00371DACB0
MASSRVAGLLLAGWLEASAGDVGRAAADLDEALAQAERLGDRRLRADAQRHLAFLRIQQGRPAEAAALAAESLMVYRRLGLGWETAASLLLAAYGAIMLGDTSAAAVAAAEASRLLTPIGDAWGQVHAEGMLGAIAHAERRFDDATRSLARAAAAAEELGFLGQAALHLATLGRVQQRAGDSAAAEATLGRAIAAARTSGDLRVTATARVHLARLRRAAGDEPGARDLLLDADRWYRQAGGDGALLTRCLLALTTLDDARASGAPALDRMLDDARASGAAGLKGVLDDARASGAAGLKGVLDDARASGNAEVETLALDGLARRAADRGDPETARRLLATADEVASRAAHVLDDADRLDAARVRASW